MAKYPHVNKALKYARDVTSGKILSCKWVRLSCQRQLDDLERWKTKSDSPYWFDKDAAEKKCKFLELFKHVRGKWAGQDFILEPWQCFIETTVFGWKKSSDNSRRFSEVYEAVPRKMGKSFRMAGNGLYMMAAENKIGAEVYCGATTQDQAWMVFRPSKQMAERNEDYLNHYGVEVNASNIASLKNGSFFRPIIGKPGDGGGAFLYICDEFHEHDTDEQYDAITQGMFDEDSLTWMITTAGNNFAGPCYDKEKEVKDILEKIHEDNSVFGIIYTIDEGDDWKSEEAIIKASPNYGVSIPKEKILNEQRKAIKNPKKQNAFKTKRLNIWCGASTAWLNMESWRKCADSSLIMDDFIGEDCFDAFDLASKLDIASRVRLFRRMIDGVYHYYLFSKHYCPEQAIIDKDSEKKDKKNKNKYKNVYDGWSHDGYLTKTPGQMIDFEFIEDDIKEDSVDYNLKALGYDPHEATYLVTRLQKITKFDDVLVEITQNIQNLSEPMQMFEALVEAGRIHHDDNPVMNWMISNVVEQKLKNGSYPRKEKPENKIDGALAGIMALSRALFDDEENSGGNDGSLLFIED